MSVSLSNHLKNRKNQLRWAPLPSTYQNQVMNSQLLGSHFAVLTFYIPVAFTLLLILIFNLPLKIFIEHLLFCQPF